jgi:transcriptional regulator with XRE-family HTH domain
MTDNAKRPLHQRLYNCLGEIVATRRKHLGMSQEELAQEADVDRAFISKVERGQRQPSFGLVSHIAQGLRMRYSRLVHNCERCVDRQDRMDAG